MKNPNEMLLATNGTTSSLLQAIIGCMTSELAKKGLEDNGWSSCPPVVLVSGFHAAVGKRDCQHDGFFLHAGSTW